MIGNRQWRTLIEAKTGNHKQTEEQVSKYFELAKIYDNDAVITISNQYAAVPSHNLIKLPKNVTGKNVKQFHWSWAFIKTQFQLLNKNDGATDQDQKFILNEILEFLESSKSGISHFEQMNSECKDFVNKAKTKSVLNKNSDEVINTVSAWHQEQKDLCLLLSRETESNVVLKLKNSYRTDPEKRLKEDCEKFVRDYFLSCSITVQNAASDIEVECDLRGRIIRCSMKLIAPKDKKSSKARVNWLLRQLSRTPTDNFFINAIRPGKAESTRSELAKLNEDSAFIESNVGNTTLTNLEVIYEIDLAGKFSGSQVFVKQLESAVHHFYKEAGQRLKPWVPSPPKVSLENEEYIEPPKVGTKEEAKEES